MPTEDVKNSTQSKPRKQDRISDEEKRAMEALAADAAGEPNARRRLSPSEIIGMMATAKGEDPGELQAPNRFTMREGGPYPDPDAQERLDKYMGRVNNRLYRLYPELAPQQEVKPYPIDPETRIMLMEEMRKGARQL